MRDLSTQLRDYMDQLVERADVEALPVRLESPESEPEPGHKTPRPGWVIALATAIIVLLLIGGSNALFNAYRSTSPADEAATTTEVASDEEVPTTTLAPEVVVAPTTVDQLTMDVTSSVVPGLGTLRWTLIEGDDTTLPQGITVDPAGGYMSSWGDGAVWRSEDGVAWSSEAAVSELDGYRWVHTEDDWAIGSNEDESHLYERVGDEWVRVELPEVPFPVTQGIKWHQSVSIPLVDGTLRVVDGTTSGWIDWGEVYGVFEVDCGEPEPCEMPPWGEWDPPSETWRIQDPHRGSNLAVLTTDVDGNIIRFVDQATGDVAYEVVGTDELPAGQILAALERNSGGGMVLAGGWVSEDEGPWTWTDFPWEDWTRVLAVPEGGFAGFEFVYEWMSGFESPLVSATVWTSADGVTWVDRGEPEFVDPDSEHMWVAPSGDRLRASVITGYDPSTGMEAADAWVSTDGLSWTQVEDPFPPWAEEHETNFGRVVTAMPQSTHMFWVSTDGATWHEVVGPPGSHEPMGAGYSGAGAAGDILWISVGEESGSRRLWIGRFEA